MSTAAAITTTTTATLPIEAVHVLNARAHVCDRLLANMDATLIAHSIIKDSAANHRLHALAIARRLRYCLDA